MYKLAFISIHLKKGMQIYIFDLMELHILDQTKSVANHFLAELRDKSTQNDRMKFRNNLKRLGAVMAFEFSKHLQYQEKEVNTPLGSASIELTRSNLYLITVLRAGLPFYNGFLEIFDWADSGFIGAYRTGEESLSPDISLDYLASDNLKGKELLLIDPMLATGNSLIKSYQNLIIKNGTPSKIHFFAAIGTPHAVENLQKNIKCEGSIWIGSLDEKLSNEAYIVPGLGDAGDLSFGSKK